MRTRKTEVNVFDAMRLSAGPLAKAKLPYAIPIGFHGHFLAA
jgi:carotenoid cleavage dioxygenase